MVLQRDGSGGASSQIGDDRLQLLHELGRAFAAEPDLPRLLALAVDRCHDALRPEGGVVVLLVDAATNELYFPIISATRPSHATALRHVRFPADRGIAGDVLRSGKAERVDDAQADSRFYGGVDRATGFVTGSVLVAPLITRRGPIGMLYATNRRGGRTFTDEDLSFLETLAGFVAVAIENAQMYERLEDSAERQHGGTAVLRAGFARREPAKEIVGTSPAMRHLLSLIESAARSPLAVLIEGETGSGKELVARRIHSSSARADRPFVAVNCAALPESLLESELFGHVRGAFTGADRDRVGLFETAGGGTILLDQVGEMPPAMQARLLRFVQEGEVVRLGDSQPRRVHARVVSATNRDLQAEIRRGSFRADLFYRLAAFPIRVPPLRERRQDIPALASHLLRAVAERQGKATGGLKPEALAVLMAYDWPGNVRELENELARALALARPGERVGVRHLAARLAARAHEAEAEAPAEPETESAIDATDGKPRTGPPIAPRRETRRTSLRQARAEFEARYIAEVLAEHGGNVSRSARALGLSRVALHRKLAAYRLR